MTLRIDGLDPDLWPTHKLVETKRMGKYRTKCGKYVGAATNMTLMPIGWDAGGKKCKKCFGALDKDSKRMVK